MENEWNEREGEWEYRGGKSYIGNVECVYREVGNRVEMGIYNI